MHDISPAWNEETIANLLNKCLFQGTDEGSQRDGNLSAGTLQVEIHKEAGGKSLAKLQFASEHERLEVTQAYQGLVVPLTHGYHYFLFDQPHEIDATTMQAKPDACNDHDQEGDSNPPTILSLPSPPLHLQLMALPSEELLRRSEALVRDKSVTVVTSPVEPTKSRRNGKNKKKKRLTLLKHAVLASKLCHHFDGVRATKRCLGIPVNDGYTGALLKLLQSIPSGSTNVDVNDLFHWPRSEKQRKGVQSENYLTLRQKHAAVWDDLWISCFDLLAHVYYDTSQVPAYNALAITKNFRGSPHIDQHDKTFQHVIALGEFEGGYLCTEYNDETELQIDVRNRLGRMDGRSVHWVSSWTGRERYSIVYYSTDSADYTNPLPAREHVRFMQQFSHCVDAL